MLQLKSRFAGLFQCMTFRSPGPPWYAARCRKPINHKGKCEFGTEEEAEKAWLRGTAGDGIPLFFNPDFTEHLRKLHKRLVRELQYLEVARRDVEHDIALIEGEIAGKKAASP